MIEYTIIYGDYQYNILIPIYGLISLIAGYFLRGFIDGK